MAKLEMDFSVNPKIDDMVLYTGSVNTSIGVLVRIDGPEWNKYGYVRVLDPQVPREEYVLEIANKNDGRGFRLPRKEGISKMQIRNFNNYLTQVAYKNIVKISIIS